MPYFELPKYGVFLVPSPKVRALDSHRGVRFICPEEEKSDQITALEPSVSIKINQVSPPILLHLFCHCLFVSTQWYPNFSHYGSGRHIDYPYVTPEQPRLIKSGLIFVKDCLYACLG